MNSSQETKQNENLDQNNQETESQDSKVEKSWIWKAFPYLLFCIIIVIVVKSCSGSKKETIQYITAERTLVDAGHFQNIVNTFSFITNRAQQISALEVITLEDDVTINKVTVNNGNCFVFNGNKAVRTNLGSTTKYPVGMIKAKSSCKIINAVVETNRGTFKFKILNNKII